MKRFIALIMVMLMALCPTIALAEEVYIYVNADTEDYGDIEGVVINDDGWYTIGKVEVDINSAKRAIESRQVKEDTYYSNGSYYDEIIKAVEDGVVRYKDNQEISIEDIDFSSLGLKAVSTGAADYVPNGWTWHMDGKMVCHHRTTKSETNTTKNPTCTKKGEKVTVVTCTDYCKKVLSTTKEEIPALGHDGVDSVDRKEPTCTKNGYEKTTTTCKRCGANLGKNTVTIPALGHDEDKKEESKNPTCTETGYKETTVTCKRCGIQISHEKEIIEALGHIPHEDVDSKDPTCTEDGYKNTVITCDRCGAKLDEKNEVIPKLGHDPKTEQKEVPNTCTEDGYKESTTICQRCDAKLDCNKEIIPAHGHNYELADHKDPTYKEEGYDYYECTYDASHNYTEIIPILEPVISYQYVYLYADPAGLDGYEINEEGMVTIGRVLVAIQNPNSVRWEDPAYSGYVNEGDARFDRVMKFIGKVERYAPNASINIDDIDWNELGLAVYFHGAPNYVEKDVKTWHLDGKIK